MTPEQQQVILEHQVWVALLLLSTITFIAILFTPTKEVDEDGKVIDLDNEDALARRRKNMSCYGRHEWITKQDGKCSCKVCGYSYDEDA